MIKVLVLGANGMLGNAVIKLLASKNNIDCRGTTSQKDDYIYFKVQENFQNDIIHLLSNEHPDYIINCIGYIRPNDSLEDIQLSLLVNSYFPKVLSTLCNQMNIRLIHVSTDCVFSGKKGDYRETDIPDATSIYGLTKYLGEISELPNITLRTSIIGHEINNNRNLLEWFLNSKADSVEGYEGVIWNGVTTLTLAKIIHRIIEKQLILESPLIHIASEKINKYELLNIFKDVYNKKINILKNTDIKNDKSLIASSLQNSFFADLILPLKFQIKELRDFYT